METQARAVRQFVFEPFRLDPADERLWHRDQSVPLGRKALAVLHCLVARAGRLVTKEEILAAAWPGTAVSEAVLTTAVRELRRALGDAARQPTYVETVHGRGYRFVAPVIEADAPSPASAGAMPELRLVGREAETRRLASWYAAAAEGSRRVGFVAGEAGIGKTSLVEAFCHATAGRGATWVGRGQCVEHYGAGEAYLPVLEALVRLGRDPDVPVAGTLSRHAPSWLPHVPALLPPDAHPTPAAVTPERMLRELAEALEVLTSDRPLILVLEDLHWSDAATLAWLGYLARRRDPARLLVLGTYRPVEALLRRHPLRRLVAELCRAPQCDELVLDYLSGEAVASFVAERWGDDVADHSELAGVLHRRTGGHPLYLATIAGELDGATPPTSAGPSEVAGGAAGDLEVIGRTIPGSLRRFIEDRLELLPAADREILEAASVAGDPFSIAAVAAATGLADETLEARCSAWTGEGLFLVADGTVTWPDGRLAARYRFRHALFHEVTYAGVSPERRARLHRLVGARLEHAWGERVDAVATELAVHFEEGREPARALAYLERAAEQAMQRAAYTDARRHLVRGLELLERLSEGRGRLERELALSLRLAQVRMTTEGWAAEEVARLYTRMRALCAELGDESRLPSVVWGEMAVSIVRAELGTTQALSGELLALAERRNARIFRVAAHMELGGTALLLGDLGPAGDHFRRASTLYAPGQHAAHVTHFGVDLGVFARIWETHLLWLTGHEERAVEQVEGTLRRSRELSHPLTRAIALAYGAMLHQLRRDAPRVAELAEATVRHCDEHGFAYYLAWTRILHGWSRTLGDGDVAGVADIRRGLEVLRTTGGLRLPYYRTLLAEACGRLGCVDEASGVVDEALAEAERTGERWWLPELHRLRGELLRKRQDGASADAEGCYVRALEVARAQGSPPLAQRAAGSLARLWRDTGREREARDLLSTLRARPDAGLG